MSKLFDLKKILFLFLILISCKDRNNIIIDKNLFNDNYQKLSDKQKIFFLDSLKIQTADFSNDSLKLEQLFKVAAEYYYIKEYRSSYKTSESAHLTAIKLKDSFSIGRSLYYMGDCFMDYQKDSAYYYYKESEKIYKVINNEDRLGKVHYNKALLLFYEGNYTESEIEVIKSLQYLIESNKNKIIFQCYSLQGSNHLELGEYDKALNYFNQSSKVLDLMQVQKIDKDAFYDYNITNTIDICNVYDKKEEYSKSIIELKKIINSYDLKGYPQLQHAVLGNLGYSLMKNKNYSESEKYLKQAIDLTIKDENNQGYLYKIIDFGELNLLTKDSIQAKQLFTEALVLSKKLKSGKEVLKTLDFLSQADKQNAAQYKSEYIRVNDSIIKKQRENREKFARIEYETDKIEDANKILSSRNLLLLLGLSIVIVLFLIVQIIRNRISRKKELFYSQQKEIADNEIFNITKEFQSELVKTKEQEQNRISKELHDGVVNQIYGIRMILGSLNTQTDEEAQKKRFVHIKDLHRLETDIRTLSHELNTNFSDYTGNFNFIIEQLILKNNEIGTILYKSEISPSINWDIYSSVIKLNIYRVLQELLFNVNKYSKATNCIIIISEIDSILIINVKDNGVGFDINNYTEGIGLKNIKERCKTINAELIIKSEMNQGAEIILRIKN